jgi:hypothetical protein
MAAVGSVEPRARWDQTGLGVPSAGGAGAGGGVSAAGGASGEGRGGGGDDLGGRHLGGSGGGGGLLGRFGLLLLCFLLTEGGAAGLLGVNAREGVRERGNQVPGLGDLGRVGALGAADDEAAEARNHLHPIELRALADADMALALGAGVGNLGDEGIAGIERLRPSVEPGVRQLDGGDEGSPVGGPEGAKGRAAKGVLFARGLVDMGEAVREDEHIEGLGPGDIDPVATARLDAKKGLDAAIVGVDPVVGFVRVGEAFDAHFVGRLDAGDVDGEDGDLGVELGDEGVVGEIGGEAGGLALVGAIDELFAELEGDVELIRSGDAGQAGHGCSWVRGLYGAAVSWEATGSGRDGGSEKRDGTAFLSAATMTRDGVKWGKRRGERAGCVNFAEK